MQNNLIPNNYDARPAGNDGFVTPDLIGFVTPDLIGFVTPDLIGRLLLPAMTWECRAEMVRLFPRIAIFAFAKLGGRGSTAGDERGLGIKQHRR